MFWTLLGKGNKQPQVHLTVERKGFTLLYMKKKKGTDY